MNAITLMSCPLCDAFFMLDGDFFSNEGRIVRAATTPQTDCKKCSQIAEVCGLTENL